MLDGSFFKLAAKQAAITADLPNFGRRYRSKTIL